MLTSFQMGPPPDPEQVITMLQNPNFASTLNEALQNPQLIDMMIQQNPMLRNMGPEVRQMMQSPEFRRMMTDPESLRNMSQMQRMFGGSMGGAGGGGAGGGNAFPAPGVTDTTPGQEGSRSAPTGGTQQQQQQQPPFNPFAMFGNPGAGVGAPQAGNPFAALLNSAPPPASAGSGTPAASGTPGGTEGQNQPSQPPNPFANLGNPNSLFGNPALMQQMLTAMGGGNGAAGGQNPQGGDTGAFNPFAMFGPGGILGGMGGAGGPPAPPDTRPPEERYADQLRQLNDMGFYEFERNVEALRRTGGSVQGAVEYLLTH